MARELPPKSLETQSKLDQRRVMLDHALRTCMGHYRCNDMNRARDLLRSHVCAIYDCLKDAYSKMPLSVSDWEKVMAEEAVEIARSVWRTYKVSPDAYTWTETLTQAIVLYVGHPLRSGQAVQQTMPVPQDYAAIGVDTANPPPLLKMAMAARPASTPLIPLLTPSSKPAVSKLAEELKKLLTEARWTAEQIADKVDIGPRNVYRHLAGDTAPSLKNIGAYEAVLSKQLGRKVVLPTPVKRQNVSKTSSKRQ
jgi:hypothetical protein